jgi:phage tail sheath protein FI|tara:strand:+ start:12751 stop:14544 length:1794 start_codon:yes stop_codon:yes gene_type:complete
MAFLVSPGVQVKETDLTNIVPAVATSIGGFAGRFEWGPVNEVTLISSEQDLLNKHGQPRKGTNAGYVRDDWYAAANFLSYANACKVVRASATGALNASMGDSDNAVDSDANIQNENDFSSDKTGLTSNVYARFPGSLGNDIGVLIVDSQLDSDTYNTTNVFGSVKLRDYFDAVPGTSDWAKTYDSDLRDECHVMVYTLNDRPTGTANEVLETYSFLSKAANSKDGNNANNFFVNKVNDQSQWVYLVNNFGTTATGAGGANYTPGATITSIARGSFATLKRTYDSDLPSETSGTPIYKALLKNGNDGSAVTDGAIMAAYDKLLDAETEDVNLLITGEHSTTVGKYVMAGAKARKDAMAFISPSETVAVNSPSARKIVDYFSDWNSNSYGVFDSGWKRQYDRYNDEFFNMPLNPDTAGVTARAEFTNDAWFSPAGLNRGFYKNVVKLQYNPSQAERDELYKSRVNPVVTFKGQGTLLFGDKTALSKPSAFDRINVRRLFIVLEKAIATAAKFQLFEFNDDFTRANFVAAVEPFLADVKSRRGMTDFKVVCDASNNTAAVIDGNRFVADIYIKPNRSINFITLNFVAVRSGVSFEEVAGA